MDESLVSAGEVDELDEASEIHDVGDPTAVDAAHLGIAGLERGRGGGGWTRALAAVVVAVAAGSAAATVAIPSAPVVPTASVSAAASSVAAAIVAVAVAAAIAAPVVVAAFDESRIIRHVGGDGVVAVDLSGQRLGALDVVAHRQAGKRVVGGGSRGSRSGTARAARARSPGAATFAAGTHALNDLEEVPHQVEGQLRAHRVEGFLERPRVVVLAREVDDEFRQRLVRDAEVVLQLRGDLVHQGEVRKLIERHRARSRRQRAPTRRRI